MNTARVTPATKPTPPAEAPATIATGNEDLELLEPDVDDGDGVEDKVADGVRDGVTDGEVEEVQLADGVVLGVTLLEGLAP